MCLATPSKVIKIEGDWATVRSNKRTRRANLSLIKNAKIGDYVIVHEDMILNKVAKNDAEAILKMVKNNK